MFFLRRGMTWLGTTAIGLFCMANHPILRAWQVSAAKRACQTLLLSPPRDFDVLHNVHADARNTPRGWPIPASGHAAVEPAAVESRPEEARAPSKNTVSPVPLPGAHPRRPIANRPQVTNPVTNLPHVGATVSLPIHCLWNMSTAQLGRLMDSEPFETCIA